MSEIEREQSNRREEEAGWQPWDKGTDPEISDAILAERAFMREVIARAIVTFIKRAGRKQRREWQTETAALRRRVAELEGTVTNLKATIASNDAPGAGAPSPTSV